MPVSAAAQTILVLQGGGALGSYQAGAYAELAEHGIQIDWVAGISIGAINAAIIAGNRPEERAAKLKSFWNGVSSNANNFPFLDISGSREWANEAGAAMVAAFGVPGFFTPRVLAPAFQIPGTPAAQSLYDTAPLRQTLLAHIDFDLIARRQTRLSVGAVNIRTGNFRYFDSFDDAITLGPEHIMASGALPPGFPPVEIDGGYYWDGGLVSNTPLDYVMEEGGCTGDADIFQVDLFSARGPLPQNLADVLEREKDIRFSSRTRLMSDKAAHTCQRHAAYQRLRAKLPEELQNDPDLALLANGAHWQGAVALAHLIYRSKREETQSKDYLFSRRALHDHWQAGRRDARRTLEHPDWMDRPRGTSCFHTFDLGADAL